MSLRDVKVPGRRLITMRQFRTGVLLFAFWIVAAIALSGCEFGVPTDPTPAPAVVATPLPPPITQVAVTAVGVPFSADADVTVTPYLESGARAGAHVVCRSNVGYFEPASFD